MKKINRSDLDQMEKRYRVSLLNCLTGSKTANLVGTKSEDGVTNLALFNSAMHVGANPPLISILSRPTTVERHTHTNIKSTGYYTLNHVNSGIIDEAHQTSAKYDTSEFEMCGLTEEYDESFYAPYVKEAHLKVGLKYVNEYHIKENGTILIIGEVQEIHINENCINEYGDINLEALVSINTLGLNSYYENRFVKRLPYARP